MSLGLTGSILLILGAFAPAVSAPIVGSINLLTGEGDGIIFLGLGAGGLILCLARQSPMLIFVGPLGLLISVGDFSWVRHRIATSVADNAFGNLIQMRWAWAILIIGGVLLIASYFWAQRPREQSFSEASSALTSTD